MYKCDRRTFAQDPKDIKELSLVLEDHGYESINLTFFHNQEDNWINVAHIIDPSKKLKYQLTIKPFATTPVYCGMMLHSFQKISPNRIVVGISNGLLSGEEPFAKRTHRTNRRLISRDFAEKLRKFKLKGYDFTPEIIFHGTSEQTIDNAKDFGDGVMMMLRDFKEKQPILESLKNKKIMVRFSIYLLDKNRKELPEDFLFDLEKGNVVYGTEAEVIKELKEISNMGATDFLISNIDADEELQSIHNLVKKLTIGDKK
jgi:alkanesulfonate monooxygenase SsuD/methylene tetrahydromethanopterin reductase-like flavin-dependent oxidoreductase (luciferase family)